MNLTDRLKVYVEPCRKCEIIFTAEISRIIKIGDRMRKVFAKYREIIVYIGVGLLTTLVAYGVRFAVLYGFEGIFKATFEAIFKAIADLTGETWETEELIAAADLAAASTLRTVAVSLGWIAGVIFAFFTNKWWVFRDKVKEKGKVAAQFGKFVGSRVGTYFVELGIGVLVPMILLACGYKDFHFIVNITPDLIATAVSVVVVTVLNYILSKLLVFGKKKGKEKEDNANG